MFNVSVMEKNAIAAVISSRGWAIWRPAKPNPRFQKGNTGATGIGNAAAGTRSPPMLGRTSAPLVWAKMRATSVAGAAGSTRRKFSHSRPCPAWENISAHAGQLSR